MGRCCRSSGAAAALQVGALDYLALGPLTNLAAVLRQDPGLARNITRVVAVMGRRPGHRFHPSENRASGAMLFGHGPIFRDLNAVLDHEAVSVVLQSGIQLVLLPYTAARQVMMTGGDLDAMARTAPAGQWVAQRSQSWLKFWHSEVGLEGFYPFDLMAAAYLRDPRRLRCAQVNPWVGDDALLPWFGGGPALLVSQAAALPPSPSPSTPTPTSTKPRGSTLYCDVVSESARNLFSSVTEGVPPREVANLPPIMAPQQSTDSAGVFLPRERPTARRFAAGRIRPVALWPRPRWTIIHSTRADGMTVKKNKQGVA